MPRFLLVSSLNGISRYQEGSGTFMDVFVPLGSGGLHDPRGLVYGPDGNLYVVSCLTHSVLCYHGVTGTFLNAFVPTGSGGLHDPRALAFGPDGHLYVGSFTTDSVLRYDSVTGPMTGFCAARRQRAPSWTRVFPLGAVGWRLPMAWSLEPTGICMSTAHAPTVLYGTTGQRDGPCQPEGRLGPLSFLRAAAG
jgi:hypothetical protein